MRKTLSILITTTILPSAVAPVQAMPLNVPNGKIQAPSNPNFKIPNGIALNKPKPVIPAGPPLSGGPLKVNPPLGGMGNAPGGGNFGGGFAGKGNGYGNAAAYGAAGLALGMLAGAAIANSSRGLGSDEDCFYVRKRFMDEDGFVHSRRVLVCE